METTGQRAIRVAFYSLWAVLLTSLTYVLGAAPLKLLRVKCGRIGYWALCLVITGVMFLDPSKIMGISFLSLVILVGVFDELEESGHSFVVSSLFTLLINSLLAAGAFALWISRTGPKWNTQLQGFLESATKPLTEHGFTVNAHDMLVQLPSAIVFMWMAAIYLAVLLENFMHARQPLPETSGRPPLRLQFNEFRLPDPVIWLFSLALLGAFTGFGGAAVEVISTNVLSECLVLFFIQGLAVVMNLSAKFGIGRFGRVMLFAASLALFWFVALFGLTDFWLDFRVRLNKRTESFKV